MNENDDKIARIYDSYLNQEQLDFLIDRYVEAGHSILDNLDACGICFDEHFQDDLLFSWAAWEIRDSEFYQEYLRQMLIPGDFIDRVTDFFISTTTKK